MLLPTSCFNRLARIGNQELARRLSSIIRRNTDSLNQVQIS